MSFVTEFAIQTMPLDRVIARAEGASVRISRRQKETDGRSCVRVDLFRPLEGYATLSLLSSGVPFDFPFN